jgi:hypothetical protein
MTPDHERIEELLAGYVLLALEGEDAREADLLLAEHVPSCLTCRETLAGFQSVIGDLALVPSPVPVPELVLPRIRRGISDVPIRRRRGIGLVAVAASVVALVGMAGLSLSLGNRVTKAEQLRGRALEVLNAMQQPGTNQVPLQPTQPEGATGGLVEVSGPGLERMYLYGRDVPSPAPGSAYQLWLGSGGTYTAVGASFVPEDGLVLLELQNVDTSVYDEVLITEEPIGVVPATPTTDGGHVWRAAI